MIRWLKNLLFGGKLAIPTSLNEALESLDCLLSPEDKNNIREWCEDHFLAISHHTLGRHLRNTWELWGKNDLSKWFNQFGIQHPDDMSGIILTTYYRKEHNLPIKLKEQIQHYIDYWQAQTGGEENDPQKT